MTRDFEADVEVAFLFFPLIERVLLRVNQRVSTHLLGQRQRARADISTDNFCCAERFHRADDQAADRPHAGDKHALALQVSCFMRGVDRDCQRFGKGHDFFIGVLGVGDALRGIDGFKSGKAAVNVGKIHGAAKKAHFRALVFVVQQTVFTVATGLRRINSHRLTFM